MTMRDADRAAKSFLEGTYVRVGTVATAIGGLLTLVWVVAQAANQLDHRLESIESNLEVATWERWTRISMERYIYDVKSMNPEVEFPDPNDERYGVALPGRFQQ